MTPRPELRRFGLATEPNCPSRTRSVCLLRRFARPRPLPQRDEVRCGGQFCRTPGVTLDHIPDTLRPPAAARSHWTGQEALHDLAFTGTRFRSGSLECGVVGRAVWLVRHFPEASTRFAAEHRHRRRRLGRTCAIRWVSPNAATVEIRESAPISNACCDLFRTSAASFCEVSFVDCVVVVIRYSMGCLQWSIRAPSFGRGDDVCPSAEPWSEDARDIHWFNQGDSATSCSDRHSSGGRTLGWALDANPRPTRMWL
jgi:hypothetical protein